MTSFESLIAEFAEKTGEMFSPAKDGSVSLGVDGVFITIQNCETRGDMTLFTFPLGDMQPEPATMEKALMLAAHGLGTDGFYLGISCGAFVLSGTMPVEGSSAEDLANKLLSLAAATAKVEKALAGAIAEYARAQVEREEKNSDASEVFSMIHV